MTFTFVRHPFGRLVSGFEEVHTPNILPRILLTSPWPPIRIIFCTQITERHKDACAESQCCADLLRDEPVKGVSRFEQFIRTCVGSMDLLVHARVFVCALLQWNLVYMNILTRSTINFTVLLLAAGGRIVASS